MDIEEKKRGSGGGSPGHRQKELPVSENICSAAPGIVKKGSPWMKKYATRPHQIGILRGVFINH